MNTSSGEQSGEKPASKGVDAAAPGSVGLDLVFENEKCEGGCDAPVVGHDSEGIPLCRECLDMLNAEDDDEWPIKCPDCGKPLGDDWHGLAACFCKWGGREPTIDEIVAAADAADSQNRD
jgi:hypothetical protein